MNFAETETKAAMLGAKEKIYILIAHNLEVKAAELRKQAVGYREYVNDLAEQQAQVWKEVDDSEF